MISSRLRDRSGAVLLVGVTAAVTALITGHSVVVGGLGLLVGLALVAAWPLPKGKEPASDRDLADEQRASGSAFHWEFPIVGDLARSDLLDQLRRIGLDLETDDGHAARLSGGSQLRTRLLGGYFVDPRHLPLTVVLEEPKQPGASLCVRVEDRLGPFALRDPAFEARYALRVDQIRDVLC